MNEQARKWITYAMVFKYSPKLLYEIFKPKCYNHWYWGCTHFSFVVEVRNMLLNQTSMSSSPCFCMHHEAGSKYTTWIPSEEMRLQAEPQEHTNCIAAANEHSASRARQQQGQSKPLKHVYPELWWFQQQLFPRPHPLHCVSCSCWHRLSELLLCLTKYGEKGLAFIPNAGKKCTDVWMLSEERPFPAAQA